MDLRNLCIIIFSGIAGTYCWAMRGTILGGEKGAMLPGAILGYISTIICGINDPNRILLITMLGMISMFQGGSCTYGETLNFTLQSNKQGEYFGKFKKGLTGVFINGGNWFSLTALFLSMGHQYKTNYSLTELVLILVLLPFIQIIGEYIFNHPYNKELGITPKIYFSKTRREEWGGNLLFVIVILVYSLFKGDFFTILAIIFGYIFGGAGFSLGLYFYYINRTKNIFGKYERKGYISNWKIMEMTLGFVGFSGIGIIFSVFGKLISGNSTFIIKNVIPENLVINSAFVLIPLLLYVILLAFIYFYNRITDKNFSNHLSDIIMRPLFSSIPAIILISANSNKLYKSAIIIYLLFVLCEKCFDGYFKKIKYKYAYIISITIISVIISVYGYLNFNISIEIILTAIAVFYQLIALIKDFNIQSIIQMKSENKKAIEFYKSTLVTQIAMTGEAAITAIGLLFL